MELSERMYAVIITVLFVLALVGAFIREKRDWDTHKAIQKMAKRD
jgi:hypothetical protein